MKNFRKLGPRRPDMQIHIAMSAKSMIKNKADIFIFFFAKHFNIYLYKFVYSGNYIKLFFNQIIKFLKFNITPIYIFDGKPPDDKKEILQKRCKAGCNRP